MNAWRYVDVGLVTGWSLRAFLVGRIGDFEALPRALMRPGRWMWELGGSGCR